MFDEQQTLWGQKTILSVGHDQHEIIKDILYLHGRRSGIELDATYGKGNFYFNGVNEPKYKFDKAPQVPGVVKALSSHLPVGPESIRVIMFDPPFFFSDNKRKISTSIMCRRYDYFENFKQLKDMYSRSLKEFFRILKYGGIVIFKCQDCVSGRQQYFIHTYIHTEAVKLGFYPKDLFISVNRNTILNKHQTQIHARKIHSYFWVLKKSRGRINY